MNNHSIILIGEDDIDDQEILIDIFKDFNESFELQFVTNGEQLIRHLDKMEDSPCLILLDYNMPELNGEQILERINMNGRFINVPKIVWSTSNSNNYRERCINAGAVEYFVKPSTIQTLKDTLLHIISFCGLS
jgi:CheY-like chemotaxis protein